MACCGGLEPLCLENDTRVDLEDVAEALVVAPHAGSRVTRTWDQRS